MVWGLDMVGPLKKALGGFTHLLIVVDKFTKWIEVKSITNIRLEEAVKFFLDIIYRFGIPNCIITDHGTNFTGKVPKLQRWIRHQDRLGLGRTSMN